MFGRGVGMRVLDGNRNARGTRRLGVSVVEKDGNRKEDRHGKGEPLRNIKSPRFGPLA